MYRNKILYARIIHFDSFFHLKARFLCMHLMPDIFTRSHTRINLTAITHIEKNCNSQTVKVSCWTHHAELNKYSRLQNKVNVCDCSTP